MKKKLKTLFAVMMAATMLLGNTVCYAAKTSDSASGAAGGATFTANMNLSSNYKFLTTSISSTKPVELMFTGSCNINNPISGYTYSKPVAATDTATTYIQSSVGVDDYTHEIISYASCTCYAWTDGSWTGNLHVSLAEN